MIKKNRDVNIDYLTAAQRMIESGDESVGGAVFVVLIGAFITGKNRGLVLDDRTRELVLQSLKATCPRTVELVYAHIDNLKQLSKEKKDGVW